ncbi:Syntaxin-18 [Coccomyxa sp. Obi]|nr:Syntaxin-18 [Coccomyxa sp. Obi]
MSQASLDRTAEYWDTVNAVAHKSGLTEDKLRKLKSAQILRSLAQKTDFSVAAVELAKNINALRAFVKEHQRDYVQSGRCSEVERDRIEEQVGRYMRSCTANIARLEASIKADQPGVRSLNPHMIAHRHGVALILSERLHAIGSSFDQCRSVRYRQLKLQQMRQQQQRKRLNSVQNSSAYRPELEAQQQSLPSDMLQEQQQLIEEENRALVQQLMSLNQGATSIETTMRELATLNQMFSGQVFHQAQQIEQIYEQAVQATLNVDRGNVQLQKAIKVGGSARSILFWFFIIAAASLLFLDWFYS